MPIFGLGLHFLVALFFAVHAIRTGRNMYWLLILFSFPLLGSIVYFFAEYVHHSTINRHFNKASQLAENLLDPEKEVREARKALDLSATAQNQVRLAKALLARGDTHESIQHFERCLAGPFGQQPDIRFLAATAKLQDGQAEQALALALGLRADCPDYLAEKSSLLLAHALAATGDQTAARAEFVALVARFGSIEARAAYAVWAAANNDLAVAEQVRGEFAQAERHWDSYTRSINRDYLRNVDEAIEKAKRATQSA